MLPPERGGPDPADLARLVERHLSRMPRSSRILIWAQVLVLDGLARATAARPLIRLDPDRRTAVLARVGRLHPAGELAIEGLKGVITLAHGADSHAARARARALARPPARPDPALDAVPARHWNALVECDAVVVGSGAGGAMAALALARAGHRTVVVEEGRRWSVDEFRHRHPLDRFSALYRDAGATVALGRPPVLLPIGTGVGGSTLVNSGTCYRPPPSVRASWWNGGLNLAEPDALDRRLTEVERLLSVGPVPAPVMGNNGAIALRGAEALGWRGGPLMRNAPGCGGCCQCSIGCPRNAKAGVHLNALPAACAAGARILSEGWVERILTAGGRARGALVRDSHGRGIEVRAPRVVVAAGATETAPLLRRSGLGAHRELGRNLTVHPALGIAGRFPEPVIAWEGVLQSAAIEEFHAERGILIEATSTPPGMGSVSLPGLGAELMTQLARADHLATLGAMIADRPSGAVIGRRRGPRLIRYQLHPEDASRLVEALGLMTRVLLAAGAQEVLTGVPHVPPLRRTQEIAAALRAIDPRRLHLAAFHPSGTARAGADADRYPVDPDGRLRGARGVWIADASILPSCPTVNPQVSIMALALGVGEEAGRD
ncbi:MAG TPA: GMC family oxidoreductase N-terminal domain-containing protein [Solirubrobacteraceae bacterium]|nr:GMC family oxidoreductase N-terminal domain-containing protein [Solirubrobacteraceae bacterium]